MNRDLCTSCNELPELSLSYILASIVRISNNWFVQISIWLTLINQLPLCGEIRPEKTISGSSRKWAWRGGHPCLMCLSVLSSWTLFTLFLLPVQHSPTGKSPFSPSPSPLPHLPHLPRLQLSIHPWGHLHPCSLFLFPPWSLSWPCFGLCYTAYQQSCEMVS